jgi:hypothetical protein
MTAPSISFTIQSSGLGNVAPSPAGVVAIFGCSSGGVANTVQDSYRRADTLVTDYGYGPGPDLAAQCIQSGIPTQFVKVTTSTPGAAGAVTHTGTGTSVMTITGASFDSYSIIVTPTLSGTVGTAPEPSFTISLDGGNTTSRSITMPVSGVYTGLAATTGLTLNFTAATMVSGDTYTSTATAPTWVAADVATAIEALRTNVREFGLGYVTGACSKTQADTILAEVVQFLSLDKFVRFIVQARGINTGGGETEAQWMAAISADYATFTTDYMSVAAGEARVTSALTGVQFRRNIGKLAIVRAGRRNIGRDIGAVADGALCPNYGGTDNTGPLAGVPVDTVYHDEKLNPGLDANRFITVTSFTGITGYYITNPNVMCSPTSDFTLLQYGRVMDEAASIVRNYFTQLLSTDVRLSRKTGFILERDALAIESGCNTELNAGIVNNGQASAAQCVVSRVDDISVTKTLTVTVSVIPLGYIKQCSVSMSFFNPVFASVAA